MKIMKKEDILKIKISHNKKLFWIIIFLLIVLIVLIYFIVKNNAEEVKCVPATCCHPTECVSVDEAPNCDGVMCTEECRAGTLDCGQGSCEFVDDKCEAVIE